MAFTNCKITRELNLEELKEIALLMENQETTDRYTSMAIKINGNYATIEVEIDEDGNVTVL